MTRGSRRAAVSTAACDALNQFPSRGIRSAHQNPLIAGCLDLQPTRYVRQRTPAASLNRFGQHADNFLALSLRGGRGFRNLNGVSLDVESYWSRSIAVAVFRPSRSPSPPSLSLSTSSLDDLVGR